MFNFMHCTKSLLDRKSVLNLMKFKDNFDVNSAKIHKRNLHVSMVLLAEFTSTFTSKP